MTAKEASTMNTMTLSSGQKPDFWSDLHWRHALTLLTIHLLGLAGLGYVVVMILNPSALQFGVSGWVVGPVWYTAVFAFVYYRVCHYSISVGAHRLYAHVAFEAKQVVHWILVVLFSGVLQGPVLWWAGKHRQHHTRTDTEDDPHSRAQGGFFHAHVGWLLTKTGVAAPAARYIVHFAKRKAERYRAVWWQMRHYRWLGPLMAYGVPVAVCSIWSDPVGGFFVAGALRLVVQYHTTWAINSVTHGGDPEHGGSAQNVPWLVYGAVGEGYHKNHHDDPRAWRFGKWDPSAAVIRFLAWCRLVKLPT